MSESDRSELRDRESVVVPVTLIFEVLRAINANMTQYESTYGDIKAPEARDDEENG